MHRALVVDDDATVSEVVAAYLERAGIAVDRASDGAAAIESAARTPPDIAILDLMLPGIDGLEVCRSLRRMQPALPVIMLTARGEVEDRILGLEVGADDYIPKPFSPRELVLRVQSILRRADGAVATPTAEVLVDADIELEVDARRVRQGGAEVPLTAREFDLLAWFLANPGRAVRREELMREVWGWDFGDPSTVTVHVSRLREKLEAAPNDPERLVTVFGVGYRWDPR